MSIFLWNRSHRSSSCARISIKPILASLLVILTTSISTPTTCGAAESDEVGIYGSIGVARKARAAAVAMRQSNYAMAQGLYKLLIGMQPDEDDFYFGLYEASRKMGQWTEVGGALNQLFMHSPEYKKKMALEYGECLYHMNRYPEAEAALKIALANISQPSIVDKQLRKLYRKSIIKHVPVKGRVVEPIKRPDFTPEEPAPIIPQRDYHPDTSNVDLNLKTAFLKSECILIATYKKYEKNEGLTSFYNPPKAIYKIEKILKGPPLNPTLPMKFEFHDKTNKPKPKDWKFNAKKMMPRKGSKWIIFIKDAIPFGSMFESYHGSWGRIPYTEDNIDKVLSIMQNHQGQTK